MRYRIEQEHQRDKEHASQLIVDATVALTLFIGILLFFLGMKGSQRWLAFWGLITIAMSLIYFLYEVFIK